MVKSVNNYGIPEGLKISSLMSVTKHDKIVVFFKDLEIDMLRPEDNPEKAFFPASVNKDGQRLWSKERGFARLHMLGKELVISVCENFKLKEMVIVSHVGGCKVKKGGKTVNLAPPLDKVVTLKMELSRVLEETVILSKTEQVMAAAFEKVNADKRAAEKKKAEEEQLKKQKAREARRREIQGREHIYVTRKTDNRLFHGTPTMENEVASLNVGNHAVIVQEYNKETGEASGPIAIVKVVKEKKNVYHVISDNIELYVEPEELEIVDELIFIINGVPTSANLIHEGDLERAKEELTGLICHANGDDYVVINADTGKSLGKHAPFDLAA